MNQVWLARHGETAWSRTGRHTGRTDVPLEPEGEQQARLLGDRLRGHAFAQVWSSPRARALRTAEIAGFTPSVVDDLAEWDYGELEGRTTPQIRETYPDWSIWEGPVPGGESAAQVSERLDRVVARCREAAGPVLLFGHGHSLRALAARWLDLAVAEGRHLKLDTSTLSVLGWERETPAVLRWNA